VKQIGEQETLPLRVIQRKAAAKAWLKRVKVRLIPLRPKRSPRKLVVRNDQPYLPIWSKSEAIPMLEMLKRLSQEVSSTNRQVREMKEVLMFTVLLIVTVGVWIIILLFGHVFGQ